MPFCKATARWTPVRVIAARAGTSRRSRYSLATALVILAACSAPAPPQKAPKQQSFSIFVTTELRGTTEPCGCNSDPLGDLARTAQLVAQARDSGRPVMVVDGGSLLYTETAISEQLKAQEALKSDLIETVFTDELKVAAIGLGPYDLGFGADKVRPPRHAANLPKASPIATEPPEIVELAGIKIGVFGVVSPSALAGFDIEAGDPQAAAARAVGDLRGRGARLVIGLLHMTQREATQLVKSTAGIDIAVVGQNAANDPKQISQAATRVGDSFLVAPANRGQVVTRLDVTMRGPGALSDAIGEARAAIEVAELEERIADLTGKLARWKDDPSADPSFVASKQNELIGLKERKQSLSTSPKQVPKSGNYFTMTQVRISKALPCHPKVQKAKQAFDKAAGAANVAAAADTKPPAPAEGKASYVGIGECEMCHSEAVEFFAKTGHAGAWETLEVVNKQFNYDCISCHVTGWDQPGGSTLSVNEHLRDVQCEVCHGPGSIHAEEGGGDEPRTVVLSPPESLCVTCHNQEHSDTFQFQAYLRNVTGPGHGEEFRQKLGDGPTGRELRSAALKKAGKSIGAGCYK
ncbi:MAG: multiheme c-type cytochrome [Myxococcota bacterium]